MLEAIVFDKKVPRPIYLQIAFSIMYQIEKGTLREGVTLPSINGFNEKFGVARDTVEKSFKELKSRGYINSIKGKGYFIIGTKEKKLKILFVFNKISNFKKIIYYSFIKTLGELAAVDIEIHHYNAALLNDIITKNIGQDIGIISSNEMPLKSLLDITVVSTDFDQMGKTAAELILKGKNSIVKNPFISLKEDPFKRYNFQINNLKLIKNICA